MLKLAIIPFFVLVILRKHKHFNGEILSAYFIIYSIARFFIEFLRGDAQKIFFGISLYQLCSVVFFITGIIAMIVFNQKKTT